MGAKFSFQLKFIANWAPTFFGHINSFLVSDVYNAEKIQQNLFFYEGHKGPVTALIFDVNRNVLVSSSKDTFVKFWDLSVQHCFKTMTDHIVEVWDLIIVKDYLISGTSDSELRVFKLTYDESKSLG